MTFYLTNQNQHVFFLYTKTKFDEIQYQINYCVKYIYCVCLCGLVKKPLSYIAVFNNDISTVFAMQSCSYKSLSIYVSM